MQTAQRRFNRKLSFSVSSVISVLHHPLSRDVACQDFLKDALAVLFKVAV